MAAGVCVGFLKHDEVTPLLPAVWLIHDSFINHKVLTLYSRRELVMKNGADKAR